MAVIALHAIFCWPTRRLQPRHPDALAHDPSGLLVGDVGVGEHVEDLVEQPGTVRFGFRSVDEPLRQFLPSPGVGAGEGLVEQLHQLVEHLDVGL
ncbi:MAG: hypothetical protein WCG47_24640, partial [Dermatophilaceae bacterium]